MLKSTTKLFAIIKDGIVSDGWWADSMEEAQQDNPDCLVIECTLESGMFELNSIYKGVK